MRAVNPIWFENLRWMIESEPHPSATDKLSALWLMAPAMNRWLDTTLIRGNSSAEAVALQVVRWVMVIADLREINPPYGRLRELRKAFIRMKGLAPCA